MTTLASRPRESRACNTETAHVAALMDQRDTSTGGITMQQSTGLFRNATALGASLGAAALAITLLAPTAAVAQQKFITIGTGGITGVYYAVGGAICRLVNKDRAKTGYRCSVE